ncbi:MAG: hypothetical protein GX750_10795 [Clostridia bacterium]|nr:hypothetical protein [Clostridia bacterium]
MDVALIMLGMAVLDKIAPRKKDLLAWALVTCGAIITMAMLWLVTCGLM